MVRLVVVALLWCAVRADEYGGAGMPLYDDNAEYDAVPPVGSAAIDYRGHSPDAPAPLDYKYDEERQGNTEKPTLDNIESDIWKKTPRKQRGRRDRDDLLDVEVDAESLPKWRNQQRAQSRLADDKLRAQDELARRRRGRQERSREDTDSPLPSDYLDKSDFLGDKNEILDEIERFTLRETTERVGRSKPKDRFHNNYVKTPKSDDLDLEEDLIADRKLKKSMERTRGLRGKTKARERNKWYRPVISSEEDANEEEPVQPTRSRSEPKEFVYYDMRRVEKIKKKLPTLLRRTTTPAPPSRSMTTDDLLDLWMAPRRAGDEPIVPSVTDNARGSSLSPMTTTASTTTTTSTTPTTTISESTELSFAEKSRLSILKKSQKKEHFKGEPSKKPPVLLHVTSNVPTIVMVEPPAATNATPLMRAHSEPYHPPKHLEKVKRLMRHKLVAGAKNIKDLTDNWDDMVCDYIDESLINTATAYETSPIIICVTLALVIAL